ncbi:11985_t:CDS:2 [Gigaspora rosea]|nr:11985_t:CDS:2 [Gigaspora rosea]
MDNHNLSVNIHTFNSEQRRQLFLALINADPTLPNMLNSERCHRLYAVLVAIDPALAQPLLDSRSAVRGIINEQFPKGSTMNPIKIKEYEDYKDTQKRNNNELQWYEFLNLDKKQYLNFRFNEANPTFPVSEADFILRNWLASYCNSMVDQEKKKQIANAKAKGYALSLLKKNVQPPARKRNTSYTQIESILDQDSIDEMTDHTRDSDTSTLVTNARKEINQAKRKKIASTKTKKGALPLPKKNARCLVQKYTNHIDIESMSNQEDTHEMTDHTQDSVTSNLEYNIPREDHDIENTDQDSTVSDDSNILIPVTNARSLFKKARKNVQSSTNNDNDNSQDHGTLTTTINMSLPKKSPMQDITNNNNAQDFDTSAPTINVLSSKSDHLRSSVRKDNSVENTLKQDGTIENNAQDSREQRQKKRRQELVRERKLIKSEGIV